MTADAPSSPVLAEAAAAADERGVLAAPAALLLAPAGGEEAGPFAWRVLAMGSPDAVAAHPAAADARRRAFPDAILTPAFANAHTHLDLTAVGTLPVGEAGFVGWIRALRSARAEMLTSDEAIEASVERGVALSLAGGVIAVGDIAGMGRLAAERALRCSTLLGASFVELLGLTPDRASALDQVAELAAKPELQEGSVRVGLQPHAPYSTGPAVYAAAARLAEERGLPLATHLAESLEERQLVAEAAGPLRELLEELGLWSQAASERFGKGCSPVEHVAAHLWAARASRPCKAQRADETPAPPSGNASMLPIFAHCNDVDDSDIELLASLGASVAHCPRSSAHLGHGQQLGRHRYHDMLDAGVPVALGTDSVASLSGFTTPIARDARLTPLDDARWLWRAGERDADLLLRMITTTPAAMLGLDPASFRFSSGGIIAGVAATPIGAVQQGGVDAGQSALARLFAVDAPPALLAPPAAQKPSL